MKIQRNIAAIMNRKLKEYPSQAEFAKALGIGHTTLLSCLKGEGNPSADTIEHLAYKMKITPSQLVAGESTPTDTAFNLISGMVDTLNPALQKAALILLEAMRQLFELSEEITAKAAAWKYEAIEPRPFQYALKVLEWTPRGWEVSPTVSEVFTDDHTVAEAAAELFTRNALSPIHLDEALRDYMDSKV